MIVYGKTPSINRAGHSSVANRLGVHFEAGSVFDWDGYAWQVLNDGAERLTIKCLESRSGKQAIAELLSEKPGPIQPKSGS